MSARLILADEPGAWITFESRGREYRARLDPMWLGVETLAQSFERPKVLWQLFDDESKMDAMIRDPFGEHVAILLRDYLDAAGLGLRGLGMIRHALDNLDLLEVDLLRFGLDIKDWLDPEGSLSSRRVVLLIDDFLDRPETRIGAKRQKVAPESRETIVLAQIMSSLTGEKAGVHQFLKSPETLAQEQEDGRVFREKRERVSGQRPGEIRKVARTEGSFSSAREDSKKALADILADQNNK